MAKLHINRTYHSVLSGQSYKGSYDRKLQLLADYNCVYYDSRVVVYDRRIFIRLLLWSNHAFEMCSVLMLLVPPVTASVDEIISRQKLIARLRASRSVLVRNRSDSIRLDAVEQRREDPPRFGEFVWPDEMHLRAEEIVQDEALVSIGKTCLAIPVDVENDVT